MDRKYLEESRLWVKEELERCIRFWLEHGMDEQLAKDFRCVFRLKADTADELAEILRSQI